MISIALRSNLGMTYGVDPHPAFFDLPGYETEERRNDTEVDVHEDCALAPLCARLNGKPALDSVPDIARALERVQKERPDRVDGVALATLLLSWATRWPDAWWDVSGPALRVMGEKGKHGVDFSGEHNERFSPRSVSTDDTGAARLAIGEIERNTDTGADRHSCDEPSCRRCNSVDDRTLQREVRTPAHGGGSNSRIRKDKPLTAQEIQAKQRRAQQEDGLTRPAFIGARVSDEAKRVLVDERKGASAGEMLEAVARAISEGKTWNEIRKQMLKDSAA